MKHRRVKVIRAADAPAPAATPTPMQVDVIDTLDGIDRLRADWQALEARDPEGTVFLSWDWLRHAFASNPDRWRVLAVRSGGRYVCFFPLKYRVQWDARRAALQTGVEAGGRLLWSEYTGFLCDPAFETQAMALLAQSLQGMPWARFSLRYEGSQNRARLFAGAFDAAGFDLRWRDYRINGGQTDNLACPQVTLPDDFEAYLQSGLSRNTRQKLRRFMRNHLDSGEAVITEAGAEDFDSTLSELLHYWTLKWAPSKGAETAAQVAANYARILTVAQALGLLYMPVLRREGRILGALGHILDPRMRRVHFIVAGRDEAADAPYVGHLLHAHAIRWAIGNGYDTYDFCHGNEAYKYSFGALDRRVNYFTIRRRGTGADTPRFDPLCTAEALRRALQYHETGRPARARAVCAQLARLPG